MIIDDNGMLDSIDEKFDHVDSSFIDILCNKHIINTFWELSKRTQHCKEVAITKRSLINIIWMDST